MWSVDLFRCESILLKSHWVMVVMDQYTRRIIGFGVYAGCVNGPLFAACSMRPPLVKAGQNALALITIRYFSIPMES